LPAATGISNLKISAPVRRHKARENQQQAKPNLRLKAIERDEGKAGKMHPIFAIAKMKREVHAGSSRKMMMMTLE